MRDVKGDQNSHIWNINKNNPSFLPRTQAEKSMNSAPGVKKED